MFEDKTFENLMASALSKVSDKMDKRQGSIVYDMIAPAVMEIASFYMDLKYAFELVFLSTAAGEYLDDRGWEIGLSRKPASPSVYSFEYTGAKPPENTRFFCEGAYFKLIEKNKTLYLEAEKDGEASNYIAAGTKAVPAINIAGLTSARFGTLFKRGEDEESDDSYRERLREKLANPSENGSAAHYKAWCESVPGVGRAKIVPLFAGENTVMGVLFSPDGAPSDGETVASVQQYIDPITLNKKVSYEGEEIVIGDGLGLGAANIGAHFYAKAAVVKTVNVSFSAVAAEGYTLAELKTQTGDALRSYFKNLALNEDREVKINKIGAIILSLDAIEDYGSLKLNGEAGNIAVKETETPVLGDIDITESGAN